MLAVKHTAHQSCKVHLLNFYIYTDICKILYDQSCTSLGNAASRGDEKFQCLSSRKACFCKHLFCFFRIVLNLNFVIVVWAYRGNRGHDRSSLSHKKTIYQYVTVDCHIQCLANFLSKIFLLSIEDQSGIGSGRNRLCYQVILGLGCFPVISQYGTESDQIKLAVHKTGKNVCRRYYTDDQTVNIWSSKIVVFVLCELHTLTIDLTVIDEWAGTYRICPKVRSIDLFCCFSFKYMFRDDENSVDILQECIRIHSLF